MQQSIIGTRLDNYEITAILGKGGMGVVYRAKDMTLDRDVALKMMDAAFARDEEFLKRFRSEAKALAKLQNPNIVSVFALRETELGLALVMEFVDGSTLADRIRSEGALPLTRTLPLFRQLLTALDHAHRAGIVHRDIKPGNVMLTSDGTVKVTDFGLAKIQQVTNVTVTMGTGGTLYYMSPEQVRGLANVDARGDIYSLGMTLYEAVTGRVPFGNNLTDFDIRQMIVEGKIPPPDTFVPTLPREVVNVIQKSLAKDPGKRYQSAAEMWDELSRVQVPFALDAGARPSGQPIPPAPHLKKYRSRLRPMVLAFGLGITLILGYAGVRKYILPADTTLSVTSLPSGSRVSVNGTSAGVTPVQNVLIQPGRNTVRVSAEGYGVKDTTFDAGAGETVELSLALRKIAGGETPSETAGPKRANAFSGNADARSVRDRSAAAATAVLILKAVPGGTASVDGGPAASLGSSGSRMEVRSGERHVLFASPTLGIKRTSLNIAPGETKAVTCYFETYLNIVVAGDVAGGTIVLDGNPTDQYAPIARFPVGTGKHRISVTKFGYEAKEGEREITVLPTLEERVIPLTFTLKKK